MYFKSREPEPQEMDKVEHEAFGNLSQDNYNRWFIPLVDDILKYNSKSNAHILDVGSGPGLLAKELGSRSKEFTVVGIDISKDALKIAEQNTKLNSNISFKEGSVYELPFEENIFDIVVCKDSLHHFQEPGKALKDMFRVLKPGGILYIQDLRRDVPMYLLNRSIPRENVVQKLQYYSVRAAYTKTEIKNLLKALKPKSLIVKTRKVTKEIISKYQNMGIQAQPLREAFQSRYCVVAKK
jgi:ubiquinone/menaquinone biosynthesis C-methylase UbiE